MAIFNPLVSSTFTGVDENPLSEGGVWTTATTNSALQRVSNAATPSGVGSDCGMFYSGATFSGNQYSRANLTVVGTAGGGAGIGLFLRQASAANTHYRFVIDHAASNNAELSRHVAGTFLSLLSWTQAFTDGDQFTFAVDGTTLYVYDKNLLLVQSFKDGGGGPTGGSPGLAYSSTETSASIDNWEGGFFAFAALGTSFGTSAHPGRSPGYAPASFRFWQPRSAVPATVVASPDVTLALTGVSEASAVGTAGVQHTNALAGVSTTTAVGSVKATLAKALSGVATTTGRGTLGVAHTNALSGVASVTARGSVGSTRAVPITGVQATGAVGTVTATTGLVVALSGVAATLAVGTMAPSTVAAIVGVQAQGLAGNVTVSGTDVVEQPISKFRYIIRTKGRLHKSSHREMAELLDRVFATPDGPSVPAPLVEEVRAIVKPFVYKNELYLAKLEKDMRATRKLLDLWTAETARMRAEDEDDDETVMLLS